MRGKSCRKKRTAYETQNFTFCVLPNNDLLKMILLPTCFNPWWLIVLVCLSTLFSKDKEAQGPFQLSKTTIALTSATMIHDMLDSGYDDCTLGHFTHKG